MDLAVLRDKLTDLQASIGVETNTTLRMKVMDAQGCILAMQKTVADDLRKKSMRAAEPFPSSRYAA